MLGLSGVGAGITREGDIEFAPVQPDLPGRWLERHYTDDAFSFLELKGVRIHYRDERPRDWPTAVAIHGMYSSLHTWDEWVAHLSDRMRVIRFDLPGSGLTGPDDQRTYTIPYYVDLLAALLNTLGVDSASVVGNSLGGGIARRFAATYSDRTERLLLLDSIGRQVVPDGAGLLLTSSHG